MKGGSKALEKVREEGTHVPSSAFPFAGLFVGFFSETFFKRILVKASSVCLCFSRRLSRVTLFDSGIAPSKYIILLSLCQLEYLVRRLVLHFNIMASNHIEQVNDSFVDIAICKRSLKMRNRIHLAPVYLVDEGRAIDDQRGDVHTFMFGLVAEYCLLSIWSKIFRKPWYTHFARTLLEGKPLELWCD